MQTIKSVLVQDEACAASAIKTYDLPVNPLSHISFTLRFLGKTDEATLAEILALITKIEVMYRGASIISASMADLFALNAILLRATPMATHKEYAGATDSRSITVILPMGRLLYNAEECFPATKKGEMILRVTATASIAAITSMSLQIETTELLGATPRQHIKFTTYSKTPSATGEFDLPLPTGNKYAGILCYSATIPDATDYTMALDYLKFKLEGVEYNISKANWETLHGEVALRAGAGLSQRADDKDDDLAHYGFVDFTPYEKDDFLVETAGKSSVKLVINCGEHSQMIRILPVELVAA